MDPRKHISYVMAVIAARDFQSVFLCLFSVRASDQMMFTQLVCRKTGNTRYILLLFLFSLDFTCTSSSLDGIISLHDF